MCGSFLLYINSDWKSSSPGHVLYSCEDSDKGQQPQILPTVVFTALHVMRTRYSDENSVRLSVCLSGTGVYCDKTEERSVQIFIPYER